MNTVESIADDGIEHARYCTECGFRSIVTGRFGRS